MTDRTGSDAKVPKEALLSFRSTGRSLVPDDLEHEFALMNLAAMKDRKGRDTVEPEVFRRVMQKSGTHLIKLISSRADSGAPVLRVGDAHRNRRLPLLPAVNATDIPYAKILFRPLEIRGETARSLVDHARDPSGISERVLEAFARVFGEEAREAVVEALLKAPPAVERLAAGEFPIIFAPRPGGGDIQITPVSPAAAYMAMKRVIEPYFRKQSPGAPRVPRGRWHRQKISDKPQNISGAIGGPRVRFLAEMPPGTERTGEEILGFVHGGRFPVWRDPGIADRVLKYADLLGRDGKRNDMHAVAELDRMADWLIEDAREFAAEAMEDASVLADRHGISRDTIRTPPDAGHILLRRHWGGYDRFRRARRALAGAHFTRRLREFGGRPGC